MKKIMLFICMAMLLAIAKAKADEFEAKRQDHGSWYSCLYMSGQEMSARMGVKTVDGDAALIIDLYAGGQDPLGIRLYTPLAEGMPPLDGRTNHGSIDLDEKEWCSASYAVYALSSSECAYAYPDKDVFEGWRNVKQCTFHIINEFGVKRSFAFSLNGFSQAADRALQLRSTLPK